MCLYLYILYGVFLHMVHTNTSRVSHWQKWRKFYNIWTPRIMNSVPWTLPHWQAVHAWATWPQINWTQGAHYLQVAKAKADQRATRMSRVRVDVASTDLRAQDRPLYTCSLPNPNHSKSNSLEHLNNPTTLSWSQRSPAGKLQTMTRKSWIKFTTH